MKVEIKDLGIALTKEGQGVPAVSIGEESDKIMEWLREREFNSRTFELRIIDKKGVFCLVLGTGSEEAVFYMTVPRAKEGIEKSIDWCLDVVQCNFTSMMFSDGFQITLGELAEPMKKFLVKQIMFGLEKEEKKCEDSMFT